MDYKVATFHKLATYKFAYKNNSSSYNVYIDLSFQGMKLFA